MPFLFIALELLYMRRSICLINFHVYNFSADFKRPVSNKIALSSPEPLGLLQPFLAYMIIRTSFVLTILQNMSNRPHLSGRRTEYFSCFELIFFMSYVVHGSCFRWFFFLFDYIFIGWLLPVKTSSAF